MTLATCCRISAWALYLGYMRLLLACVFAVMLLPAQDWTPARIVAITDYAPLPRQARIAGEVQVRCLLNADGTVMRAEVVSGHPLLKEQARQNTLLWKFRRTSVKGGNDNVITLKYEYLPEGELKDQHRTAFVVDLPDRVEVIAPSTFFTP